MTRLALALLTVLPLLAQRPEYDFYRESRGQQPEAYAPKLRSAGLPEAEIARRVELLRDHRDLLEADRWNRSYGSANRNYNRAPNAFRSKLVAGLKPGVALDYAMGDGRNALYLAKLGWTVHGFDMSDAAITQARQRARELGLSIHAVTATDAHYKFGQERLDLIVFSWSMPLVDVRKVIASLKPGGIVVMESGPGFTGRNGMLRLFDALEIEYYEKSNGVSDFSDRRKKAIFRLIARR